MIDKKVKHIIRVADRSGCEGVLKLPRKDDEVTVRRFREEARRMQALTEAGKAGILPVLDIDLGSEPGWFVMPTARMLSDVLRERNEDGAPNLWDVVAAVAEIASILARLAEQRIAHRDIKPPNLFWLGDKPVVGDFGIAAWPDRPGLTLTGENVGPMYFIAPEMRQRRKFSRDFPADVWSLTKTLFVLARGLRYPPEGTHYVQGPEFDLWNRGGPAAIDLARILEATTAYRPHERLTMAEFTNELNTWLRQHARDTVVPRTFRTGWASIDMSMEQARRYSRGLRQLLPDAAHELALALHGDASHWEAPEEGKHRPSDVSLLADHGLPENSRDGFEPDDIWVLSTKPDPVGRRIALGGLLLGPEAMLVAEIQRVENGKVVVKAHWRRDGRVLLSSGAAARDALVTEVEAWLRSSSENRP
ncbi:protein kinase [Kitasatospora sp. YST-16]|uniref:protein kinase domain-containing protein n=1 Tax=Kitasatospora sp. YST-16 TaxID=2998080 RepID=UPI002283B97F|nr:protein kinase [Kitasatospora sp. YST-16]WAL71582.1 protein kinase [Kitasatospora sp. YST-16]WNW37622.1 protein kinase [Streptomyces sp. Li-HN-5-13]